MRIIQHIITASLFLAIGLVVGASLRPPTYITETIFFEIPGPATIEQTIVETLRIPDSARTSTKTYMDYRAITRAESAQYKLIHSDEIMVDERGFLITEDGYIGAALGSYFGPIGEKFIFTFEDGRQLKIIKVEAKSDLHTCGNNILDGSNAAIEFVIDSKTPWMNANRGANGLIFNGNFNAYFNGKIESVNRVIG